MCLQIDYITIVSVVLLKYNTPMSNYFSPLKYENDEFQILDQTRLPNHEEWIALKTEDEFWHAINTLKVRGAPAIGVAAAYGAVISLKNRNPHNITELLDFLKKIKEYLSSSRPTAVNLFWALDRIDAKALELSEHTSLRQGSDSDKVDFILSGLITEAEKIRTEDVDACKSMGEHGLSLLKPAMGILTHCNAGALATAGYGTCLSPIYLGNERDYNFKVYADETRPLLQGARLTAWELNKAGVDVTLLCDNMVSSIMSKGLIDAVVVGCDRMAANGDGANKIGTSGVAILAKEYNIPFYMFVPESTIDRNCQSGIHIPIENRDGKEIYSLWYRENMAPENIKTYNPAFDVTSHQYITAVVTENGVFRPPYSFKKS